MVPLHIGGGGGAEKGVVCANISYVTTNDNIKDTNVSQRERRQILLKISSFTLIFNAKTKLILDCIRMKFLLGD